MKIPKDKLPLIINGIGKKQMYGQYTITRPGGYAGRIVSKDLSQYVVKAANEFPDAIMYMKRALPFMAKLANETDNGYIWREAAALENMFEKFLNKLEDEKA